MSGAERRRLSPSGRGRLEQLAELEAVAARHEATLRVPGQPGRTEQRQAVGFFWVQRCLFALVERGHQHEQMPDHVKTLWNRTPIQRIDIKGRQLAAVALKHPFAHAQRRVR